MSPPDLSRLLAVKGRLAGIAGERGEIAGTFEKLAGRADNGTARRAVSAWQLFQTPEGLASRMVELLGVRPGQRILEPSAGLGRIVRPLLDAGAEVVAVENSPDCAGVLYGLGERVRLLQRDFLSVTREDVGKVNGVAMNPPFHMRADIRHILHAREVVDGGKLVALCMDTPERERVLRPLASHWERVPPGAFRESGTGVGTVLLKIG